MTLLYIFLNWQIKVVMLGWYVCCTQLAMLPQTIQDGVEATTLPELIQAGELWKDWGKGIGGRELWEGDWTKGTVGREVEEGNCGKGIGGRELEEGNCGKGTGGRELWEGTGKRELEEGNWKKVAGGREVEEGILKIHKTIS